jgi:DNA transformation protein
MPTRRSRSSASASSRKRSASRELVALYLKADGQSRPRFLQAGLKPFVWNKRPSLNYYRAPAEALESPDEAMSWAREALAAALRSRKKKP